MSEVRTFESLDVWKSSRDFRNAIFEMASDFPDEEKYRLKDQIIRSSRGIGANIAEEYGRFHYQENIQFCRQSRGPLFETLDHLYVALDRALIKQGTFDDFRERVFDINGLLNGYISYIKKQRDQSSD